MMRVRWSRLGLRLCRIDRHAPIRHKSRWNGWTYSGVCRDCGAPIVRTGRGLWQARSSAALRPPAPHW
jgi:hypothetical protein